MDLTRRKFLTRAAVFIAAPAIIRVADLMPIKAYAGGYEYGRWEGDRVVEYGVVDALGGFEATFDPQHNGEPVWKIREFNKRGLTIGLYRHANPYALAQAYDVDRVIDRPGKIEAKKYDCLI